MLFDRVSTKLWPQLGFLLLGHCIAITVSMQYSQAQFFGGLKLLPKMLKDVTEFHVIEKKKVESNTALKQ